MWNSGCDPRAVGLAQTSEGRPKFTELHDCSGAGDIDTKAVVVATVNGTKRHSIKKKKVEKEENYIKGKDRSKQERKRERKKKK